MAGSDDIDVGRIGGAQGPAGSSPVSPIADNPVEAAELSPDATIAGLVTDGTLPPARVEAVLIEQVIAEQMPADTSPELLARATRELRELLAGDPALQALLRGR